MLEADLGDLRIEGFANPFADKAFELNAAEVAAGTRVRKIKNIKITYDVEKKVISLLFRGCDLILAWGVATLLIWDMYSFDPDIRIYLEGHPHPITTEDDSDAAAISTIKSLAPLVASSSPKVFRLCLCYSGTEAGENAFRVNFKKYIWADEPGKTERECFQPELDRQDQVSEGAYPETDEELD